MAARRPDPTSRASVSSAAPAARAAVARQGGTPCPSRGRECPRQPTPACRKQQVPASRARTLPRQSHQAHAAARPLRSRSRWTRRPDEPCAAHELAAPSTPITTARKADECRRMRGPDVCSNLAPCCRHAVPAVSIYYYVGVGPQPRPRSRSLAEHWASSSREHCRCDCCNLTAGADARHSHDFATRVQRVARRRARQVRRHARASG
jgi:hypothetical protein